jgi:hypothetical protein
MFAVIDQDSGIGPSFITRVEAEAYRDARPSATFDIHEIPDDASALRTREVLADEIDEDPSAEGGAA